MDNFLQDASVYETFHQKKLTNNLIYQIIFAFTFLIGMIYVSFYNYLLFHSLIELFSIIIAFMMCVIAINTGRFFKSQFGLILGISYGIIGFFDLLHTLAFKGMGVFPGSTANLPTELWIISRYLESIALFISCILVNKIIKTKIILVFYIIASICLFACVFIFDIFPDCYIEGYGLTDFKKISECIISLILSAGIILLFIKRKFLQNKTFSLFSLSIFFTIMSEVAFIFYIDVYGLSNMIGHIFKLVSFYLIYKAIVEENLLSPQKTIVSLKSQKEHIDLLYEISDKMLKRQEVLGKLTARLLESEDPQDIMNELCTDAMEYLHFDAFFNYIADEGRGLLHLNAYAGIPEEIAEKIKWLEYGQFVCGCVAETGQRFIAEHIQSTTDLRTALVASFGIQTYASFPLKAGRRILGTLSFGNRSSETISEEDLSFMGIVTDYIAIALSRLQGSKMLKQSEAQARSLAAELEQKNKLITDFFINISHEFKTPLSILVLGIDLMEQKAGKNGGKADISKNIAVMRQNSYRLNRLVANLLDITKLDAGFMEPKWERTDIVGHLASLIRTTEAFAAQRGLKLEFASNAESMILVTDSFMFERIVLNLLSNAIKHTPAGGSITVSCVSQYDRIAISVKDSGEGIPDDKKGIIFDRFQQVNTSLARSSEGCGIGLSLTKSFAELLGGGISFESTLGIGSEFVVSLPVLQIEVMGQPVEQNGLNMSKRIQIEFSDIL